MAHWPLTETTAPLFISAGSDGGSQERIPARTTDELQVVALEGEVRVMRYGAA